jgi:hypothetical protein
MIINELVAMKTDGGTADVGVRDVEHVDIEMESIDDVVNT